MNAPDEFEGRELMTAEAGTVALLNRGEIDMQIATAHKYPRSIAQFRRDVMDMVTISEQVAQECIYALPRDGKVIEGPSARFAEVIASAWGNGRAGARVVDDRGDFVTAQGVYHDLQKNVAITYEVQRRITGRNGFTRASTRAGAFLSFSPCVKLTPVSLGPRSTSDASCATASENSPKPRDCIQYSTMSPLQPQP